jgi:hypothetical protein
MTLVPAREAPIQYRPKKSTLSSSLRFQQISCIFRRELGEVLGGKEALFSKISF